MPVESRANEEHLSGNADWFRLMFERSADSMTLLDPATMKFLDGNETFARTVGIDRREIPNISPVDLAPEFQPDGRPSRVVARETILMALKNGSHRSEWLARRMDGTTEFIDVVSTSLSLGDRNIILTAARNIDDQKRTEAELRLSESRWRRVFEQIPMSMQLFAPDGSTREINRAYEELFHLKMEDLEHFNILKDDQLIAAGFQPMIEQAFHGEASTIPPIPFEARATPDQPTRGLRWVGSTMFPVMDDQNRIIEVVCVHQDHTARKLAEDEILKLNQSLEQRIAGRTAELKLSEERFKRLFEFSPLGIGMVDEKGMFQQTNSALAEIVGYTTGELCRMNYRDILPPNDFSQHLTFDKLNHQGRIGPFEKEYLHRDGRRIPVMLNGMKVISSTGEVQIWGIAEDITQRREAERAVRESEEKFKSLFQFSPLGMARVSWEGDLLQVNESFARMIGYTPEEATRLNYWDITPRKYESQELLILDIVKREGRFGPFEKEYVHRDGHLVPIVINGMLIHSAAGTELWGIAEDITLRRATEEALRESERKFRVLFESSSQGVMLHNENECFAEVNPAAAAIFGYHPSEMVGVHPAALGPEFQPDGEVSMIAARRHIARCIETGRTKFEWLHYHADGHEVLTEVVLTRIPHGEKNLLQAVVTDISERKRAETELKRALERERELNHLKSNFVSMVSHEFRTPLGIIQSSAEILDDYLDQLEPTERGDQLQSIIKNSRRMAGLMEDVLLLGRLDARKMEFLPAPLDLGGLCRRLVDEVHFSTDARCPIEFSTVRLPAEARADERLLRHILINLLNNAVKYSTPGSPIVFHASGSRDSVNFRIQDRGIGIPTDEHSRLFEAFQRGSNVGQTPGTGLGLVIVKQSVELHGGSIELESEPGIGTTFSVTIPLTEISP